MHLDIDGTRYLIGGDINNDGVYVPEWDRAIPCCPRCDEPLEFDNDTRIEAHWHDDYTIECPCGWEGQLTV